MAPFSWGLCLSADRSVADTGCLSRILIFFPSRILDRTTTKKDEGWGDQLFVVLPCFVDITFTKSKVILFLTGTEQIWASWQLESRNLFPPKNCNYPKLSEIWDLEKNLSWIPDTDPGLKKYWIPDLQHWLLVWYRYLTVLYVDWPELFSRHSVCIEVMVSK